MFFCFGRLNMAGFHKLSKAQRLLIENEINYLRLRLLYVLRRILFIPKAMKEKNLTAGFISAFDEFEDAWQRNFFNWGQWFVQGDCLLVNSGGSIKKDFFLYSKSEVEDLLRKAIDRQPSIMPTDFDRSVYYSALIQFGSLMSAFAGLSIEYRRENILQNNEFLEEKIMPFLGVLPDSIISKYVDYDHHWVKRVRINAGGDSFSKDKLFHRRLSRLWPQLVEN